MSNKARLTVSNNEMNNTKTCYIYVKTANIANNFYPEYSRGINIHEFYC